MPRVILWSVLAVFFATLVESTILARIAFLPAMPDLVLLIVLWISIMNGSTAGTTTGFISGLILDFLSASPIGLNALTKTVTAYIAGRFSGSFNMNRVALPVATAVLATFSKAALVFIASLFFGASIVPYSLLAPVFWYEVLMNAIMAPPVFLLLSLFPTLFRSGSGETE